MKAGVTLPGARITIEQVTALGLGAAATVAAAVAVTIVTGLLLARLQGRPREEGKLGWAPVAVLVVETAVVALFTGAVIAVWHI